MTKKTDPVVIMMCTSHKKYKAIYPPKTGCIVCWKIYATRMSQMNVELKAKVKELENE